MKRKSPYHKKRWTTLLMMMILLIFLGALLFLYGFEQKMLPTLQEIAYMESKAVANDMIDDSLQEILQESQWTTTEFFLTSRGEYINYSANTTAINLFCSNLTQSINQHLYNVPEVEVSIPIGAITDISMFSNVGPEVCFSLLPAASVISQYDTTFESAGINQLHYKLWITLTMEFQIVNPIYHETISMERNIMLVDTIIGGKVPENLLTLSE